MAAVRWWPRRAAWAWAVLALLGWAAAVALACDTHEGDTVLAFAEPEELLHNTATAADGATTDGTAAAGTSTSGDAAAPAAVVLSDADKVTPAGLFQYANRSPTGFYSLENFPGFALLQENIDAFREEAVAITEVLNLNRKQNEWTQGGASFLEKLMQERNRGWTVAWDGNGKWLNYALVYHGNTVPGVTEQLAPRSLAVLRRIPGIRIGGFSRLLPGAYIAPHTDSTGLNYHSLAFHLCLTGRASLRVGPHWVEQAPGKVLIFDSNITHEVQNGDEDRILLYLDFDVDVFLRETAGYDPSAALTDEE